MKPVKKLRAPAYPLFVIDPYTSCWSCANDLTAEDTRHWTGKPFPFYAEATIDGTAYRFIGKDPMLGRNAPEEKDFVPAMTLAGINYDTFSTYYTYRAAGVELTLTFTSPLIPTDFTLLSRPVSYLKIAQTSTDGKAHTVCVTVKCSDAFCLDRSRQCPVVFEEASVPGASVGKMGGIEQPVLGKVGDDLRIDWGYVYLGVNQPAQFTFTPVARTPHMAMQFSLQSEALITLAYDDISSLTYFGTPVPAYWKKDGKKIETAIAEAYAEYDVILARCAQFDADMMAAAEEKGGEEYAEILALALRQVCGAHKLCVTPENEIIYVSKECFSNGCAATVDVSYPSIPLFLLYNPELVRGMMRPVLRYAESSVWQFPFAPHDAGTYPILNGQKYSLGIDPVNQMPVEECGNMLVMAAAVCKADGDTSLIQAHRALFDTWADYLLANGTDPENQLCTDDFAGHLAHNCNLTLKAIMGLAGYSAICTMWGEEDSAARYMQAARKMADEWKQTAKNEDGSFRLAFDRPGTFSMKYNAVWDKIWHTGLFGDELYETEAKSYFDRMYPYGLPLDNRTDYTKSDWMVWSATLLKEKEDFMKLIHPLWLTYHVSPSRVPLTDWYFTITSLQRGFQNRTVQGGLWMKMLAE